MARSSREILEMSPEIESNFDAMFRKWHLAALKYARRSVPSSEAEDIVAEVFIVLWKKLKEGYKIQRRSWLFRVISNKIGDHIRSVRNMSEFSETSSYVIREGFEGEIIEKAAIRSVLDRITPRHSEALLLSYWRGVKAPLAAQILGLSQDAFRKRLSRARKEFKRSLGTLGH